VQFGRKLHSAVSIFHPNLEQRGLVCAARFAVVSQFKGLVKATGRVTFVASVRPSTDPRRVLDLFELIEEITMREPSGSKGWTTTVLAVSIAGVCTIGLLLAKPATAQTSGSDPVIYLDQGWSQADREMYYQITQGSTVLSYKRYGEGTKGNHEEDGNTALMQYLKESTCERQDDENRYRDTAVHSPEDCPVQHSHAQLARLCVIDKQS
jgi:hypothetical protein